MFYKRVEGVGMALKLGVQPFPWMQLARISLIAWSFSAESPMVPRL
jgi:hypothetical protein